MESVETIGSGGGIGIGEADRQQGRGVGVERGPEKEVGAQLRHDTLSGDVAATLGTGFTAVQRHQDVRRLEVAVDDTLLVSMLDGLANLLEQLQPLVRRLVVDIAELRDGHAAD